MRCVVCNDTKTEMIKATRKNSSFAKRRETYRKEIQGKIKINTNSLTIKYFEL